MVCDYEDDTRFCGTLLSLWRDHPPQYNDHKAIWCFCRFIISRILLLLSWSGYKPRKETKVQLLLLKLEIHRLLRWIVSIPVFLPFNYYKINTFRYLS